MDKMTVRDARHDEAAFIVQMIRHMVVDMASYGGNTPATDGAAWEKIVVAIAGELKGNNVKYLVAKSANGEPIGVAGAELTTFGGAAHQRRHCTSVSSTSSHCCAAAASAAG